MAVPKLLPPGVLWGALSLQNQDKTKLQGRKLLRRGVMGSLFPTLLRPSGMGMPVIEDSAVQFGWEHGHLEESLREPFCLCARTGPCHRVTVLLCHNGGSQQRYPAAGEGVV